MDTILGYKVRQFYICQLFVEAVAPGGFCQGLQSGHTQLSADGFVQFGGIGVRTLQPVSQHLLASLHQLADQRCPGERESEKIQ